MPRHENSWVGGYLNSLMVQIIKSSRIEHPTSNFQLPTSNRISSQASSPRSKFGVECSMFDVQITKTYIKR